MAITPAYGPRVRFAAVITDAPLAHDPRFKHDLCQDCTVCQTSCLGGAITEDGYDPQVCVASEAITGMTTPQLPFSICPAPCYTKCPVGRGWPPKNHAASPTVDRPLNI